MSVYGNDNLFFVGKTAYITTGAVSENVTLPADTAAVSFVAEAATWVLIGAPGETPTAAAPSGEKEWVDSFYLAAGQEKDVAISRATDAKPIKIAAIQHSASGLLAITARKAT